ncbi:hypothetical protein ACFVWT_04250 [Arthrobacter sp. NPDC058288]|uniref:hypothetical protein n=1 Tax=Arthrobacter sp. NPDC058288 TaxID=3346424 RepID=UPI0036EE4A49
MATQKVPTLDGSGRVREKHLPTNLGAAALNATYALKGETSGTLIYSAGAYPARPAGAVAVTYIGPVQPTTWIVNDTWKDNS